MELNYNFPPAIDNTMRTCWDSCERKFLLSHVYNLRASDPSIHLVFGAAYAKGLEIARKEFFINHTPKEVYLGKAYIAAIREWDSLLDDPLQSETKCLTTMLCALEFYFMTWPVETDWCQPLQNADGEPAVEFTFAMPLPYKHPQSGDPMMYAGRFDQFVDFGGVPAVYDDKTTSQLGASWINGWTLDSQMTGYIWAGREHGYNVGTALIRGVSILKNSFGHADAIEHRTNFEVEDWHRVMLANLGDMIKAYEAGEDSFLPSYGQACKAYGGCPYISLCKKENWKDWIEPTFHEFIWNPLDIKS